MGCSGRTFGFALLAPAIEANGALASVKLWQYDLPVQEVKTAKELDLSNKQLGHLDAIVIAPLIQANGALVSLDISNNEIGAEGAKHLAPALQEW